MNKNQNKKAVSLPILLLVLSSILLSGLALFYFNSVDKDTSENIFNNYKDLDNVYEKKELIDFYINDIFDDAVKDFEIDKGKKVFLENFKKELDDYKDKKGDYPLEELKQLENVNEENILITENSFILKINIIMEEEDNIKVVYNYEKIMEKEIRD